MGGKKCVRRPEKKPNAKMTEELERVQYERRRRVRAAFTWKAAERAGPYARLV